MSRFTPARRAAIAIWTGASVVWATTMTTLVSGPADDNSGQPQQQSSTGINLSAPVPSPPESGLVVVRGPVKSTTSTTSPSVAVQHTSPPTTLPASPPPTAPPPTAPPQPSSRGS